MNLYELLRASQAAWDTLLHQITTEQAAIRAMLDLRQALSQDLRFTFPNHRVVLYNTRVVDERGLYLGIIEQWISRPALGLGLMVLMDHKGGHLVQVYPLEWVTDKRVVKP